jgi:hypothetical protein
LFKCYINICFSRFVYNSSWIIFEDFISTHWYSNHPLDIVTSKQHICYMIGKFNSFPFTNKEFVIRKTVKSIRGIEMYAAFSTSVFLCHHVSEEIFYRILFCSYSLTRTIFWKNSNNFCNLGQFFQGFQV